MKKLLLLILLMLVSLPSFSQTVTDTSLVILPEKIARAVIKDILLGDALRKELDATQIKLSLVEQKVVVKDSVIFSLEEQITNLQSVDLNRKKQVEKYDTIAITLEMELDKQIRRRKFFQYTTGILAGAAIVLGSK